MLSWMSIVAKEGDHGVKGSRGNWGGKLRISRLWEKRQKGTAGSLTHGN